MYFRLSSGFKIRSSLKEFNKLKKSPILIYVDAQL